MENYQDNANANSSMIVTVLSLWLIAELWRLEAEHHKYRNRTTCMHRKRKPWNAFCMVNIASGMDRGRMRPTRTKLLSRYRAAILQLLSPPRTSLILDIHVMVNWHLSKQDRTIRWPVWRNNFVGSGLELIEVTRSMLNFTAAQLLVFDWIAGSSQINLLWPGAVFRLY